MEFLIFNQLPAFRMKSTATNYHTEKPELSGHESPQKLKRVLALHDCDERSDFKRNSGAEGIPATLMGEHEAATTEDEGQSVGEPGASLTKRNEQDDEHSDSTVLALEAGNKAKLATDEEHLVGEALLDIPTLKDVRANGDNSDRMTRQETGVNVGVGVDGVGAVKIPTAECSPGTRLEFNYENFGTKATSSGTDGTPVEKSEKTAPGSIGMMLELDGKDVACGIVEIKSCLAVTAESIDRNADDYLSSTGDQGQLSIELRRKSIKHLSQAENLDINEGLLQQTVDIAENSEVKTAEGFQDVPEAPSHGGAEGEAAPLCDHVCPSGGDAEGDTIVASAGKLEASKNVPGQSFVAMDSNRGTTSEVIDQVSRVPTTSSLEEKVASSKEDGQFSEKSKVETGERDGENESADEQPEMRSVPDSATSREITQVEVSSADVLGAATIPADLRQLVPNIEGVVSKEELENLEAHGQQVDNNLATAIEDTTRVQSSATVPKVGNSVISVDGQLVSNDGAEDSKEQLMDLEADGQRLEKMDTNLATFNESSRAAENSLVSFGVEVAVNCAPAGQPVLEVMRQASGEQAEITEVLGRLGFKSADKAVATLVIMPKDISKASNPEAAFPGKDCTLTILDEDLLARKARVEEGTEPISNLDWHGKVRLQNMDAAVCTQSFLKLADVQIADELAVAVEVSHATSTNHDGPSTVGPRGEAGPSDLRKFEEEEQVGLEISNIASPTLGKITEVVAAAPCITDGEELAPGSKTGAGTEPASNLEWDTKVRVQCPVAAVCTQSFLKDAIVAIADGREDSVELRDGTSTNQDGQSVAGTSGKAGPSDLRKFEEEEQVALQFLDVASTVVEKKNEVVAAAPCITDGEELAPTSMTEVGTEPSSNLESDTKAELQRTVAVVCTQSSLKDANVEVVDCQEGFVELGNGTSTNQDVQSAAGASGEAGPNDVRKFEEEEQVGLQTLDNASTMLEKENDVVAAAPCITYGEELAPSPRTEAGTDPSSNLEPDTKVELQSTVAAVCTQSSLIDLNVEIANGQEGSVELCNGTSTIQDGKSAAGTSGEVGSSDLRNFEEEEQVESQILEGVSTVVEKKNEVVVAAPCITDREELAPNSRTEAGTDPASNLESDTKVRLQSMVAAVCTQSSLKDANVEIVDGQEGSVELPNGTSIIQDGKSAAGTSGEVGRSDLRNFEEEEQVGLQILEGASTVVEKKSEVVAAAPCITDGEELAPNSGTNPASNLESDTKVRLQSTVVADAEAPQSGDEKELSMRHPPEFIKVYVRRRRRSSPSELAKPAPGCTQTTTQGKIHHTVNEGWLSSVGVDHTEAKNGDASLQKVFKHYTRRLQSQTRLHNLANAATMTSIYQQLPKMETPRAPGKGSRFVVRARGRTQSQTRFVKKEKDQAVQESSKETGGSSTDKSTSSSDSEMQSTEKGSSKLDDQLDWLPEGWTLEIKVREAGSTVGTRDKYYYDPKSGHRFRSKNEVLQYLEYGKLEKWRSKTQGLKSKSVQSRTNTKTKTPIQTVAAKPSIQSAPANFSSTSTPAKPPARITPKATASQRNTARMKTTPVTGNSLNPPAANGTTASTAPLTWAPIYGPNGPIWLPWGGPVGQVTQNRVEHQDSDAGAPAVGEGGAKGSQLSIPAKGVQPPTTSAGAPREGTKDQGEQENRGKLIFRLKRKQPDPDSGKGRSKRPMYEVVHREKASSSASTDTQRDKQTPCAEGTGQEIASTCVSTLVQEEKQPLSTGVSQEVEPPVKKRAREFSVQTSKGDLLGNYAPADFLIKSSPEPPAKRAKHQRAILPKWSDGQHVPQQVHQPLHQLQQTPHQPRQHQPYTALGIPATASASGLQQMGQFNATHVFLPPLENAIPLSWQYPFSQTCPTPMPAPILNLGPFPSAIPPSAPVTYSAMASVPIPNFEHFPGPAPAMLQTSSSSLFPCSEIGTGCTERDSAKPAEVIAHAQRFSGSKALTKIETSKLLEGLGRRILSEKLRGSAKEPKFSS